VVFIEKTVTGFKYFTVSLIVVLLFCEKLILTKKQRIAIEKHLILF
jgi:hypothetical protein